ncbi:hypothetical protein NDU88_007289 [Pleurodeles waltl]|uniref:Uncharacterized protein n=1 Tax=Pleurodeles waltl TaxID=8319 RepID=A0AAV7QK79_PLEWA|nr:hypothetical protein NDU88_007289 [Pleurodeles waltl]
MTPADWCASEQGTRRTQRAETGHAPESVAWPGYIIGQGTVKPQLEKVQAITQIPLPKRKKDDRAFFGMVGYYQRFIPPGYRAVLSQAGEHGLYHPIVFQSR